MDSTPNMHLSSSLKMSPLLLLEAILGLQNHRDGFCIADGIKENQDATFRQLKITRREKSHSANEFVLAERRKNKNKNQQCCCFADLVLRSLVVSVLRGDLSYQLTKMT